MSVLSDAIAAYYPRIDAVDLGWVVHLFSPDAVYERADVRYCGAAEIERFFRDVRKIRGVHEIEHLWEVAEANVVIVQGRFQGVGEQGDPRRVGFADIWHFNERQQVDRRQTFLALGNAYVRD